LIAILDYGSGNIKSAQRAFSRHGAQVEVTSDFQKCINADGLVIPGVGAFAACMEGLLKHRADAIVDARLTKNLQSDIWISYAYSNYVSKYNFNTKSIKNYNVPLIDNEKEKGHLDIFIDKINRVWVTSNSGMVYILSNENKWDTLDLRQHSIVTDIDFDSNNNAWIGTNKDLVFYDGIKYIKYNKINSDLVSSEFVSVNIIDDKNIWLVTFGFWPSITKYENGNFILKGGGTDNINQGLGPYAHYVYKDRKGRLFFCSNFISVLDGSNINLIPEFIPKCITEVNGYHLFTTYDHGLVIYDYLNKTSKILTPENSGLLDMELNGSIQVTKDSAVWIATEKYGIAIWDLKNTNRIIL
jgi:ligand-binding sensor domain-containing protein